MSGPEYRDEDKHKGDDQEDIAHGVSVAGRMKVEVREGVEPITLDVMSVLLHP